MSLAILLSHTEIGTSGSLSFFFLRLFQERLGDEDKSALDSLYIFCGTCLMFLMEEFHLHYQPRISCVSC